MRPIFAWTHDVVMRQGLAPSLQAATRQVGADGSKRDELDKMRDSSLRLVNWLQNKAKDRWADTPQIREVIESLEKTRKELEATR